MSVESLPTFKKSVEASVVATVEELLALAKAGEISSIAAVVMKPNGNSATRISATTTKHALIGSVALLLHDLMHGT